MPHRIRLRRPWKREVYCNRQLIHVEERVDLPDSQAIILDEESAASHNVFDVTYHRSFNCPTGLEPTDKLSIELQKPVSGEVEVRLNGESLPRDETVGSKTDATEEVGIYSISEPLRSQNSLEIHLVVTGKGGERGLQLQPQIGGVALKINS
ncbi:hypothetical protein LOC71_21730 [Rhodopirellula sp. JC740]|uniref:DUF4982 domain-containing protein n=1 Tax=Rhodopirellula halodulae TaxID=2894198 RepID=A0ABS8NR23_9BACT|nr:hypothetical protein [Rhodopirellula sp. JC740]MCC9644906.1 hypothetical protein [Rhodopirellula sp. JC740]